MSVCDIKEIASATGRDVRKVLKDVKKMITKGWFCQGHLDEKESCLMVSEHAWNQYTALMEDMKQRKAEEQAAQKKMQEEYDRLSPEVQKIVQAGDEYVRKIKAANDAIPGEVISAKISRMELLVDRIFDRVEQNPDSVNDMRRMMDYYLPTTMKLLEAYEELDAQPVQGENIISSKKEIEDTIDSLSVWDIIISSARLLSDLPAQALYEVLKYLKIHPMLYPGTGCPVISQMQYSMYQNSYKQKWRITMSDAFKDVSTVPTLTLEPFQAEEEKKPAVQPEEPKLDDTILTEEERRMVDAFAQQIDLTNSSMILQYGAGTQKKMADFSESALENVKSKDLGEVGTLLTNVVTELKSFDEEESKGFLRNLPSFSVYLRHTEES